MKILVLVATLVLAVPASAQTPAISIGGDVATPVRLTAADLAVMPRDSVAIMLEGEKTVYGGVNLSDILARAGLPFRAGMHGTTLAGYIVASASDGYQVVFSLGEVDAAITDTKFLLADRVNGKPLDGENGNFRLVIPSDKRGARSLRMLTSLTVVQLRK